MRVNNSSPCAALCTAALTMRPAPVAGTYFVDAASELLAAFQEVGALARQELVSCVPPALLVAKPGDVVADLCAAPGHESPAAARRRRWRRPCGCVGGRPEAVSRPCAPREAVDGEERLSGVVRGRATLPRHAAADGKTKRTTKCCATCPVPACVEINQ